MIIIPNHIFLLLFTDLSLSSNKEEKLSDKYKFFVLESNPLPNKKRITEHDIRDHYPEDFPERF